MPHRYSIFGGVGNTTPDDEPNDAFTSPISSTFPSLILTSSTRMMVSGRPHDPDMALQVQKLAGVGDRVGGEFHGLVGLQTPLNQGRYLRATGLLRTLRE